MKTHESIEGYEDKLAPELRAVVRVLRAEIERSLPAATSKVWHGHPIWFDGDNPIVGYDARKATVTILFWNGRALHESGLTPMGKDRAAGKEFRTPAEIDKTELRRCLDKARINVFDSVGHFRALREEAKRVRGDAKTPGGTTPKAKTHSTLAALTKGKA